MAEKTIELVDARLTEAARILVELAKQSKQTQQELAILSKRSDERFERFEQSLTQTQWELQSLAKQTRAELDSLSQEVKATAKQVKETTRQMGEQSRRMGTLVEDIVSPDMLRILRQVVNIPEEIEGIINVRQKEFYAGQDLNGHPHVMEFDAMARCGDYVLVNETKTTLRPQDVTDFVTKLTMARDYFPQLVGKKVIGAVSSLWVDESLRKQATRQGLLVLALGEGMLQLRNEPNFQPKIF